MSSLHIVAETATNDPLGRAREFHAEWIRMSERLVADLAGTYSAGNVIGCLVRTRRDLLSSGTLASPWQVEQITRGQLGERARSRQVPAQRGAAIQFPIRDYP